MECFLDHGMMDKLGLDCDDDDCSSVESCESDLFEEEVHSSGLSSPTSHESASGGSTSSSSSSFQPLQDMSSLLQELPIKRGLSRHYNGKSQSFTSLSKVISLEDLAKPENPYNKKLKSCKSYGGLLQSCNENQNSTRFMSKKTSRGSCSSLNPKRNNGFIRNRVPNVNVSTPQRSTSASNFANQPPLLA